MSSRETTPLSRLSRQELSKVLAKLKGEQGRRAAALPRLQARPRDAAALPLSFAQQRLWLQCRLDPDSPAYNVPAGLALAGRLGVAALAAALGEVVRRHEALRTVFRAHAGVPHQEIVPFVLALPVVELSALADPSAELSRLGVAEARRPFDLARGPLLRVRLMRLGENCHALLVTFHHIVSDGWSLAVFLREVAALYRAALGNQPASLPPLPLQVADFAAWQREWLSAGELDRQLAYWRQALAGLPEALELPTDRPRPATQSLDGRRLPFALPGELSREVAAFARAQSTTPFVVALAAFEVLLARLTGVGDLAVGTTVANRNRSEVEGLIGFFVNTLALRAAPTGRKPFRQLVAEVRETTLAAQAHQDLPFEKLVEELAPARSLAHSPIFQVGFDYQADPLSGIALPGLAVSPLAFDGSTSKLDLLLSITAGEGWTGYLEFSTALFDPTTARRLLAQWRRLLATACRAPETRLAALPWLTAAETRQLLGEWGDGGALAVLPRTLPELLAARAAATPEAVALVSEDGCLSYAELADRAAKLARQLAALGVGPEVRVGLCLPRTEGLVVALLAVVAAGGAYVPFEPPGPSRPGRGVPAERLAFLFEDSGMEVLLTEPALDAELPPHRARSLEVDRHGGALGPEAPPTPALPDNIAYVIYTSGSTGRPKGVAIPHRATVAFACWARDTFSEQDRSGVLAATSVCFDLSIFEIFVTLAWGGRVILADDALHLLRHQAASEVRLVNTVPSAIAALVHQNGLPATVETVNLAGEALKRSLVEEIYACPGVRVVHNLYGPSEDTTYSTWTAVPAGVAAGPTIGRPLAGSHAYVLDRERRLQPQGVPGHLHLAGAGLARGYNARAALTAERFVPDPFAAAGAGGRMYRTGDLARWLPDGRLDFLGRIDHQVKVRGFRIELGEIEAALLRHPRIAHAVAVARPDSSGDPELVAYVVGRDAAPRAAELQLFLGRHLPDYMLPARLVVLPALPLTPNGKVDRTALPQLRGESRERAYRAPQTVVEQRLAGFFTELLGVERVGLDDGFFELGGHSLKASQLVARARDAFGVELPLRTVFEAPTVAALAAALAAAAPAAAAIPPVPRGGWLPLSFAQRRLWFLDQLEPGSLAYLVAGRLVARGRLEVRALSAALGALVARHEALRVEFVSPEVAGWEESRGEPVARLVAAPAPALPVVDLSALDLGAGEPGPAERLGEGFALRPFRLDRWPLLRFALLRLGSERHELVLAMHHIVTDGWSLGVLLRELAAGYEAAHRGAPAALPALKVQYADFAAWQRQRLDSVAEEEQLAYWRQRLDGLPPLALPTDRPRPAAPSLAGASLPLGWPAARLEPLLALARREGVTPFVALLALLEVWLARLSGQRDFGLGTPVAGRGRLEIEPLIGFFVNVVVMRAELAGRPSFRELLVRARRTAFAAFEHQDLPFERLVEVVAPERALARTPLFQAMFTFLPLPLARLELPGLTLEPRALATRTAKFDLLVGLFEGPAGLAGVVEYATALFDESTVARWISSLELLLGAVAAEPERRIGELPFLSPEEEAQLLRACASDGPAPLSEHLLHELFAAQAQRQPWAIALVTPGERLSYRELDRRANRLAWILQAEGVGPESRVGVCLPRDAAMVVALLAVLKAGGAYVPFDPLPEVGVTERFATIFADGRLDLVLAHQAEVCRLPAFVGVLVAVDFEGRPEASEAPGQAASPARRAAADNAAYLIYTSGSTGKPKGVVITHRSAVALAEWARHAFGDEERDGVLAATSICFDLSIFELWVTLGLGGKVILAENALALPDHPAAAEVRLVNTVPSAIAELVRLEAIGPAVTTVNLAGEALQQALVETVYAATCVRQVWNLYGPSEDTTYSTWARVARGASAPPFIGRPLPGSAAYVLDAELRLAPRGAVGELWLAGAGLARGYHDRPSLTAERFRPHPFGDVAARLYQTGDLARFRADGQLDYLGRADHQVKVRGYRIELGEVEAALLALPGVREAVATADESTGEKRLVAYLAPAQAGQEEGWRQALATRIPDYMVPSLFVSLAELPKNANGKLDRGRLPRPPMSRDVAPGYVAPRSPLESRVAEVFAEVLGLPRVGVEDTFFALGGHSLKAMQLASRLRQQLSIRVPIKAVFETPTVAAMAAQIAAAGGAAEGAIPRLPRGGALQLSFAQRRLWFLDQLDPASLAYLVPGLFTARGRLDVGALGRSLAAIVGRHEALRTVFVAGDDADQAEPTARLVGEHRVPLPVVELSALGAEAEQLGERLAGGFTRRPFDLGRWPLLRWSLLRLSPRHHGLALVMHHIVTDGWSLGIFLRELAAFYLAEVSGTVAALPELPIQYADFAAWQRGWLAAGARDQQMAFWRQRLAGLPPLALPTDRVRPAVQSLAGEAHPVLLPNGLVEPLLSLGRRAGATPFIAVLAVVGVWLSRLSGQRDFAVGSPIAGRGRLEIEPLIGFFVNTLVLRADLAGRPSFHDVLARTRQRALEAFEHQDVPFEQLVEELAPGRGLSHPPLFQAMFTLLAVPLSKLELPGLSLEPRALPTGTAKFDLLLGLTETPLGLAGVVEVATALFDPATIARWVGSLEILITVVAERPDLPVFELPFLSPEEQAQLLGPWASDGPASASELLLHQLFEARVAERPEATALVTATERLSCLELDRRANGLARVLVAAGVGPESRVGVCLPRESGMVVALLAVWKAGGAYVPIDPEYPLERQRSTLADSGAALVLASPGAAVAAGFGNTEERAVEPGMVLIRMVGAVREPPLRPASADNAAYLIYTSGSTGTPKGVVIAHRAAVVLAHWAKSAFSDEERDGVLAATSICFDLSVFELWVTLGWGGKVVLAQNALELAELEAAFEVRLINTVPSAIAELVRLGGIPSSVVTVNLAGEALKQPVVEAVYGASRVRQVWNLYGPSEDTTYSTWARVENHAELAPAIGRPLPGTAAYLLDPELGLVPQGGVGELYLAGAGLSRGYHERPGLTAQRYRPCPFQPAGARMYQTGDLARFRPDGQLDYLGRSDHQVKVRGFRIELGEIENALLRLPGVREAVVVAHELGGEPVLVAYLAPAEAGQVEGFRRELATRLPEHLVPALFVPLAELPHTANGKVDRKRLPRPTPGERVGASYLAPRTPREARLAEIFASVLGVERVGVDDSFFSLGGHSLKATRLVSRLREVLGVKLPVRAVFEAPTVSTLAAEIAAAELRLGGAEVTPSLPLVAGPRPKDLPLSFAQERLWILDRIEPGNAAYNIPMALALHGQLDVRAFSTALNQLVARHESLRTTFGNHQGQPFQSIAPRLEARLAVIDLEVLGLAPQAGRAAVLALAHREAALPFDLERGPLFRGRLARLSQQEHALLFDLHHSIADGWAISVLVGEWVTLYAAAVAGKVAKLPALPLQYPDYALWQRRWLSGPEAGSQLDYWRTQLAGLPQGLDLPTDWPRPAVRSFEGARESAVVPAALSAELGALAARHQASLFMVLLAAFKLLLSRWSGEHDLAVGSPIAGRNQPELEGMVGMFLNTLVLRTNLADDPSFAALLGRVRETTLAAYVHQDLPFEQLLDVLKPERDLSRTPFFQVFFNMLNFPRAARTLPGLAVEELAAPELPAKFDLTVYAAERGGEIHLDWVYNAGLISRLRAAEMVTQYLGLLAWVAATPEQPVSAASLLTAQALAALPDPRQPLSDHWRGSVAERFAARARQAPEKIALVDTSATWSYGELDAQANRVAWYLLRSGVAVGDPVAIWAHRSGAAVWALLATAKAGGAFVMLDPSYPAKRLVAMLAQARPKAFLVLAEASAVPAEVEGFVAGLERCVTLELPGLGQARGWLAEESAEDPEVEVGPDELAYLAFTSGSTGEPKGVMGRQGPLTHFLPWQCRQLDFTAADRFSLLSGLAHDPLQRDVVTPLTLGATICVPEPQEVLSAGGAASWLARQRVSIAHLTPAMGQVLVEPAAGRGSETLTALRRVLLVGDILTRRDVDRLRRLAPGVTVVNLYGSTETQRAVAFHVATAELGEPGAADRRAKQILPLGRGMEDVQLLVLAGNGLQSGIGELGEICVRSPHLAAGYLGDAELSASRFVPNPFGNDPRDRLYKTGDLGRYLPNGEVAFAGRADKQVKIRGFRIELGEIEAQLGRLPGVLEAVVLPRGEGAARRLTAFVVATPGIRFASGDLRELVAARVPAYMVPASFLQLPGLPLTPNGKVDREVLLSMEDEPRPNRAHESGASAAPETAAERRLLEIFRQVLGHEAIGVEDNFFELGGNSLLLVQMHGQVQQAFARPLAMVELFDHPTIRSLARLVAPAAEGPSPSAAGLEQVTKAQEGRLQEGRQRLKQRLKGRAAGRGQGPSPSPEIDLGITQSGANHE